jgi:hypothetical protein
MCLYDDVYDCMLIICVCILMYDSLIPLIAVLLCTFWGPVVLSAQGHHLMNAGMDRLMWFGGKLFYINTWAMIWPTDYAAHKWKMKKRKKLTLNLADQEDYLICKAKIPDLSNIELTLHVKYCFTYSNLIQYLLINNDKYYFDKNRQLKEENQVS